MAKASLTDQQINRIVIRIMNHLIDCVDEQNKITHRFDAIQKNIQKIIENEIGEE